MLIVAKLGTSSLVDESGLRDDALGSVVDQVADLAADGHQVIVVASGAAALGLNRIGLDRGEIDAATLQAAAQVGQVDLMTGWREAFAHRELSVGQVLLSSLDFFDRRQYLHGRSTMTAMLELGVVPILNENNVHSDLALGGNDRLAALVAHMVSAELLVLLTDTPGLFTADPRIDREASLIEEIVEVDHELERAAGGASSSGTGGMASKLAAAKIAAWSGVPALIAAADRKNVLIDAVAGVAGIGTTIHPRRVSLRARKLWIAFAVRSKGRVVVDDGARTALANAGRSLLPAGVLSAEGSFEADDAIEVVDPAGVVFAKGLVRHGSVRINEWAGRHTSDLPPDVPHVVIHRDDLVVLPS